MPERRTTPRSASIGGLLKAARERTELSQEGFASLVKVTRNYVGMVERGERNATFDVIDRWIGVAGLTWVEFARDLEAAGYPRVKPAAVKATKTKGRK